MVGDNEATFGIIRKLELRFFLSCILLGFFCLFIFKKKSPHYPCVLGQGPDCPASVLSLETPVEGVDNGVPSCADVRCGFLPQQCLRWRI